MQQMTYYFDTRRKANLAKRHLDKMIDIQNENNYPQYMMLDYQIAEFDKNNIRIDIFMPDVEDIGQLEIPFAHIFRENEDSRGGYRNTVEILNLSDKSTSEQKQLLQKKDIRKEPCDVCGQVLSKRRVMYVGADNETGELKYFGKECVKKEFPEITFEIIDKYMKNLKNLKETLDKETVRVTPDDVNVEEFIKAGYDDKLKSKIQIKLNRPSLSSAFQFGPGTKMLDFKKLCLSFEPFRLNDKENNQIFKEELTKAFSDIMNSNDFISMIKRNRELPGEPMYNLRELLASGTFTENRTNEIQKYLDDAIDSAFNKRILIALDNSEKRIKERRKDLDSNKHENEQNEEQPIESNLKVQHVERNSDTDNKANEIIKDNRFDSKGYSVSGSIIKTIEGPLQLKSGTKMIVITLIDEHDKEIKIKYFSSKKSPDIMNSFSYKRLSDFGLPSKDMTDIGNYLKTVNHDVVLYDFDCSDNHELVILPRS